MPRIMSMSGFLKCQGLKYNEKSWSKNEKWKVLEQATLIFEMELFKIW